MAAVAKFSAWEVLYTHNQQRYQNVQNGKVLSHTFAWSEFEKGKSNNSFHVKPPISSIWKVEHKRAERRTKLIFLFFFGWGQRRCVCAWIQMICFCGQKRARMIDMRYVNSLLSSVQRSISWIFKTRKATITAIVMIKLPAVHTTSFLEGFQKKFISQHFDGKFSLSHCNFILKMFFCANADFQFIESFYGENMIIFHTSTTKALMVHHFLSLAKFFPSYTHPDEHDILKHI